MKKTLTSLFLTLSLVLTILSSSAIASAAKDPAGSAAAHCYALIEDRLASEENDAQDVNDADVEDAEATGSPRTKAEKDLAKAEKFVADANAQIEAFVARAQCTPKDDVELLYQQIDRVVTRVARLVRHLGFDVACEYVTYEIDGQTVLVDPLKVVN